MSRKLPQLVVLCEDAQHGSFLRSFLYKCGWERHQMRMEVCPKGKQSAEQWVRDRYPVEVGLLRSRPHVTRALVVVRDGDAAGLAARKSELDETLAARGLAPRRDDEKIAVVVPCRNIETWLAFLAGHDVDESSVARPPWPACS